MPTNNKEIEELKNFLEKCEKEIKEEIDKLRESGEENQKQELEIKIEKVQALLNKFKVPENSNFVELVELGRPKEHCSSTEGSDNPLYERYIFESNGKTITLDVAQKLNKELELRSDDDFCVAKEVLEKKESGGVIAIESAAKIFTKRLLDKKTNEQSLLTEETNKGKIVGVAGGAGLGAAGGAAAGAGAMILLAPYTFGLSSMFVVPAAVVGGIWGSVGGGATGLAVGAVTDSISNAKIAKTISEVRDFLTDYKNMMKEKLDACQNKNMKDRYSKEIKEIEAYMKNNSSWIYAVDKSQIIQNVKDNPQDWKISEVTTSGTFFGTKTKEALIHRSVEIDSKKIIERSSEKVCFIDELSLTEMDQIKKALEITETRGRGILDVTGDAIEGMTKVTSDLGKMAIDKTAEVVVNEKVIDKVIDKTGEVASGAANKAVDKIGDIVDNHPYVKGAKIIVNVVEGAGKLVGTKQDQETKAQIEYPQK